MTHDQTATDRPNAPAKGLTDLVCDPSTGRITAGADAVQVGLRGARILSLLLDRRGTIVPQAELIAAGWQGYVVEESSLVVEIASLRGALHRLLGGTNWISGIAGRGYRLALVAADPELRMPGRWDAPSIGVMPMAHPPGDFGTLAASLTATVTATLALHAGLSVSPAHVATLLSGLRGQKAAELGLRYLLESSLHGTAEGLRITVSLSDTVTGRIVWTDSFDAPQPLSSDRQDRLAAEIVQALDVLLVRGEEAAIGYLPTRNLRAWSHYIRGLGHAYWPRHDMLWGSEIHLALIEWKRALALDPDSTALLASIGAGHAVLAAYPASNAPENAQEAARHLQAALDRDPDHPVALAFHAMMLSESDRFEVAAEVARRAIRLAPDAPAVTAVAGVALCAAGFAAEAVQAIERTLAATPHFPSIYTPPLARAWRSAGRVEEAIRFLEALNEEPHKFDGRELILAYMQAGRHEDAVNVATQLLLLEPGFTISGWLATQHRTDSAAIARDAAALRAVGLPE